MTAPSGCRCRARPTPVRARVDASGRRRPRPPRPPRRARRCRPPGRGSPGRSRATRASGAAGTRGPCEKCLYSSPTALRMTARATAFGSTASRCSYQPIASASSVSEAQRRANVRVSAGSSSGGSWYWSNPMPARYPLAREDGLRLRRVDVRGQRGRRVVERGGQRRHQLGPQPALAHELEHVPGSRRARGCGRRAA